MLVIGPPEIGALVFTCVTVPVVPGSIAAVIEQNDGFAGAPVQFPNTRFAFSLICAKEITGLTVGLLTDAVKRGGRPFTETLCTVAGGVRGCACAIVEG